MADTEASQYEASKHSPYSPDLPLKHIQQMAPLRQDQVPNCPSEQGMAYHGVFNVVVAKHAWGYEDVLMAQKAGAATVQLRELGTRHSLELGPVLGRDTIPYLHSTAHLRFKLISSGDLPMRGHTNGSLQPCNLIHQPLVRIGRCALGLISCRAMWDAMHM